MFIHRIKLTNLLSFGPDMPELELKPLNVLIGPNGSGKSNFIEAVSLLHATRSDLTVAVREHGEVQDWLWQYESDPLRTACIEAVVQPPATTARLRHRLKFSALGYQLRISEERIESESSFPGHEQPYIYFALLPDGRAFLDFQREDKQRELRVDSLNRQQSVLAQRMDLEHHPELFWLGIGYTNTRLYRDWHFGRGTSVRGAQRADLPNDFLMENCQNLGLMLNRLKQEPTAKEQFLRALRQLYEDIVDFDVRIVGGAVQVTLQEGSTIMPATRLSDGTLRYLCLLAILCHPKPPRIVCIEEPELGLHPDILPGLAELLREASERCQLIVTTHSDVIVDALTDTPESVVVCEKHDGQTHMKRLDRDNLSHWLDKYRLGELWSSGELGGNRW